MKRKALAVAFFLAGAVVWAVEVRTAVFDGSSTGGVAPKPYSQKLTKKSVYVLQCGAASCYRTAAQLQADGGLAVSCAQDYNLAALEGHEIETGGTDQYISVGAVADGGTADCRLFFKTKNP